MDSDRALCPHCQKWTVLVRVAGHTQCQHCHYVIDECCSGETIGIREESPDDT